MASISLKQLEAFAQVAKLGSFKNAAAVLNTTQPNISNRINTLENRLGQIIMERDAGSVRLTPIGKQLLGKTQDVLSAVDNLMVAAENPSLFEGVLRLGVTETIAHSWLGEFLNAYSAEFHHITVDLTVDLSEALATMLTKGIIDLSFQSGPFDQETTQQVRLGDVPLVWVASPDMKLKGMKISSEMMSEIVILSHARNTVPFQQTEKHFADLKQPVRLVPSTSLAACLHMTLQGLGVACLPRAIVEDPLKAGTLHLLNYHWAPDDLKFEARIKDANAPHHVNEAIRLAAETV